MSSYYSSNLGLKGLFCLHFEDEKEHDPCVTGSLFITAFMMLSGSAFAEVGQDRTTVQNNNNLEAVEEGSESSEGSYGYRGEDVTPAPIASCSSMTYEQCLNSTSCYTHVIRGTGNYYCTSRWAA